MSSSVSLAAAETYFANRLYADAWTSANEANKTKALAWAEALVVGAFAFTEDAYRRDGSNVVFVERVVSAICEEAIHLLKNDPTAIPDVLKTGISEGGAGSARAKFDKRLTVPFICDAATTLIGELGVYLGSTGSVKARPYAW